MANQSQPGPYLPVPFSILVVSTLTYPDFAARWRNPRGAERANQPLSAKDQTVNQQGLASVVLMHQQLDIAVAEAYAWSAALPDAELLTRLVRLNYERAREEQQRQVRYLRPAYQAPE